MKHVTKRVLAVALALVLCLSLLPGIAMAADSYVKMTGLSDVTAGGKFVLVANGFAMDTAIQGNQKFNGVAVTPNGSTLSGSVPVWTFETVTGGIAISYGGQYLAYDSGTNFKMQADPYTWTVSVGNNGFQIKSAASTTRGIFLQNSSSRFGAYSTTNTSGYIFDLELYKLPDGTPSCDHAYTSKVTTALTCTQDGVETFTCSKCGDTYTKTTKATGHEYVKGDCVNCDAVIVIDPAKIIPEAYALAEGETLGYDSTLVGEIISVDEEYSTSYKNITVTIAVEGYEEQPIKCFRLKGDGAENLAVGDIIAVTGMIKNYKGTIEFDTGCKLDDIPGVEPEVMTPAEIVDAAYALETDTALEGTYTLTGVITSIDTPYSSQYNNITVTIAVEGKEDKPVQCFRLKGENADKLKPGDTITVTGSLSNYRGTVQFGSGCTFTNWIEGEGEEIIVPDDPKEIVDAAYELAPGAVLPYEATLTGMVTEIVDAYSEQYSNITVSMVIDGREEKPILCYRMKGEGADTLAVGDVITVTGNLKNYTKTDSETGITTNTIEFTPCSLIAVNPIVGVTVSGAVVTGAEGDTTIELIAGEEVVATTTVSGKEGTFELVNVAIGTYTLKVSKLNHVTREYTVNVDADILNQDVKIHMVGDINGDGRVNMGDVGRVNNHVKGVTPITDEYQLLCANVNGGILNMGDTGALYAHIRGTKKLY